MKKVILFCIAISLIATCCFAKTKLFKQQNIECVKTNSKIIIDGQLDDAWKAANVYSMYIVSTTKKPLSPATVRCMYDDENFYVYMKTKDKDIKACETRTDAQTCFDDVLEFFIKPGKNCNWYYNVEINALGTSLTGLNHVNGGSTTPHTTCLWHPNIEYKVFLAGTINNPFDEDKYWILEAKLPFKELQVLKGKTPKQGDVWQCNFSKYDYSVFLPDGGIELSSVCHTDAIWFHEIANYCPLIFK